MFNPLPHQFIDQTATNCGLGTLIIVALACFDLGAQEFEFTETSTEFADACVGDELWLISSRDVADCQACVDTSQLKCERWINGGWRCTSLSQLTTLHKTDYSKETVIYAHGNRTNDRFARYRGIEVYHNLFGTPAPRPPIRFVIWAWRSEKQQRRPKPDFVVKSKRAIALGKTFNAALYEFGQHPPLLIGYSLGAQLIAAGLTDESAIGLPNYRLGVIAPVLDCDFAGMYYDPLCECQRLKSLVIFTNLNDRVIRLAKHTCRHTSRNNFQSFEEWATGNGSQLGNVRLLDVSSTSNAHHSILMYSSQHTVKTEIHKLLIDNTNETLLATE